MYKNKSFKLAIITLASLINFSFFSFAQEYETGLPSLKKKAEKPSLKPKINSKDPYAETDSKRKYWPYLKFAPTYPHQARLNNLEGYVIVIFDISRNGHPTNIRVEKSSNPIFNEPAILSAERYVYKFSTEPDKEIMVKGVRNKISFKLDP